MILQSALLAAGLASFTAATAIAPIPKTGQAQLASKLMRRQSNRMDIVRRASQMKKRQNGPSAVPTPTIFCGSIPALETFYLSTPDPLDPTRLNYITSSISDIDEFGATTFYFADLEALATPYIFDEQCRLSVAGGTQQVFAYVAPETTYANANFGTQDNIIGTGSNALVCADEEGELRCGSDIYLPIELTQFCQSPSGTLQLTSQPPQLLDCTPLSLSISNVPPPQPPQPMCGDTPVGEEFYLSLPDPSNPEFSRGYGRAEDGNIAGGGNSPLYYNNMATLATPFVFNAECQLVRVTIDTVVTRMVTALDTTITLPRFATDQYIDANAVELLTCTSVDRVLSCGNSLTYPADDTTFCLSGLPNPLAFSISSNPPDTCVPVALQLTASPFFPV